MFGSVSMCTLYVYGQVIDNTQCKHSTMHVFLNRTVCSHWYSLVPRLFYLTEEKKSLVTTVCACAKFWRNSVKIVYYCSRPCSAWRTITSRFLNAQAWQRLMILRVLHLLHWIGWAALRWLWRRSSPCGRHIYEGQDVFIWLPAGRSFGIVIR